MFLRLTTGLAWPLQRRVERDGVVVALTAKEAELLRYLARHPRVVGADELMARVWGWTGASHTVATTVYTLRRKIEADPARPTQLVTVRGEGYRFVPTPSLAWPAGVDGSRAIDGVLAGILPVLHRDAGAGIAALEALVGHPDATGDRLALLLLHAAGALQRRVEVDRAEVHVVRGLGAVRNATLRGRLHLVRALLRWRRGAASEARAAPDEAARCLGDSAYLASVDFHRELFAPRPAAERLAAPASRIAGVYPTAAAVYLLAGAMVSRGDARLARCEQAEAIAAEDGSLHERRLACLGQAAAWSELGRPADADAAWQRAQVPDPRAGEAFGVVFAHVYRRERLREASPPLPPEASPFMVHAAGA